MTSPAFVPLVGGLEIAVRLLAEDLTALGHEVVVLTETPASGPDAFAFRVVRHPGPLSMVRWTRWCDVFVQANISLRMLWPLLLVRRPWVVAHHSWYRRPDGSIAWQDRLKRFLLRYAAGSLAVSDAMARDLEVSSQVVPNSYDDRLFRRLPETSRERELVFVGRLVSDKGVDVLLEALVFLARGDLRPRLTIVGDGPEAPGLRALIADRGLAAQVEFLGTRTGENLVRLLNEHRILVVPSRYHEPFGRVALEGIACGCVVIGSEGGGLPEAIGPCGRTFPNGDARTLAGLLGQLLADGQLCERLLAEAARHLSGYTRESSARVYDGILRSVVDRGAAGP